MEGNQLRFWVREEGCSFCLIGCPESLVVAAASGWFASRYGPWAMFALSFAVTCCVVLLFGDILSRRDRFENRLARGYRGPAAQMGLWRYLAYRFRDALQAALPVLALLMVVSVWFYRSPWQPVAQVAGCYPVLLAWYVIFDRPGRAGPAEPRA